MNIKNKELLRQFFACYFHQDWMHEASNPEGMVAIFLETAQVEIIIPLRDAIILFANSTDDDAKLEKILDKELGSYYLPSLEGKSAKKWLLSVADLLNKSLQPRSADVTKRAANHTSSKRQHKPIRIKWTF